MDMANVSPTCGLLSRSSALPPASRSFNQSAVRFCRCNAALAIQVSGSGFRQSTSRHGRFKRKMWEISSSAIPDGEESKGDASSATAISAPENDLQGEAAVEIAEELEEEDRPLTPEEEEDQECIDQIVRVLELLKINRDMTPNEVRLIVMIEDPRESENLGMLNEDGEWTSLRDEMGNAVIEISEGRVPEDREVLRALRDELISWPNLEEMADTKSSNARKSSYAKITDTGLETPLAPDRADSDWDAAAEIVPGQKQKDLSEKLPSAVGFGFLYFVSFIPILIGVTVVAILYYNSFQ